jgi:hypothetical protein
MTSWVSGHLRPLLILTMNNHNWLASVNLPRKFEKPLT